MAYASDLAERQDKDLVDGGDVVRALFEFDKLSTFHLLRTIRPRDDFGTAHAEWDERLERLSQVEDPFPPLGLESLSTDDLAEEHALAALDLDDWDEDDHSHGGRRGSGWPQKVTHMPLSQKPRSGTTSQELLEISASLNAILERRRIAEDILNSCDWYGFYKTLSRTPRNLSREEDAHRRHLLRKAENEINKVPRCRKAFLYVQYLDEELKKLRALREMEVPAFIDDVHEPVPPTEKPRKKSVGKALDEALDQEKREEHEEQRQIHLTQMQAHEEHIKTLEEHLATLEEQAKEREDHVQQLEGKLNKHLEDLEARENSSRELEEQLEARNRRSQELEQQLKAQQEHTSQKEQRLSELEKAFNEHQAHIRTREEQLQKLETTLKDQQDNARSGQARVQFLEEHLKSTEQNAKSHETLALELREQNQTQREQLVAFKERTQMLQQNLLSQEQNAKTKDKQIPGIAGAD